MRIKYRCRKRLLILSLFVIFIFILLYFFWSFHSSLETEITNPDSHLNHSPQTSFFDLSFLPTDPKKLNRKPHICPEPNPGLELDFDFCMPHFIIFGGMKCGTTSLWEYLGEHPDVLHVKDDHYFFPDDIRKKIEKQLELLRQKEKKWLYRDFPYRNLTNAQKKLLPTRLLPPKDKINKDAGKVKRTLNKLLRPIIGAKEVRWFGPSCFKWASYFAKSFVEPLYWYSDSFPRIPKYHGTEYEENYGKITGEASPTYLHGNNQVIERAKYFLPDVKMIILLRNPVERFLSMQRMKDGMAGAVKAIRIQDGQSVKPGGELSLDDLVAISDAGPVKKSDNAKGADLAKLRKINRDLKGSRYADKVSKVLLTFDADQVLVIQSEFFYKNTPEVMHEIETFLGISHIGLEKWETITSKVYNLVMNGRNRTFTPVEGKQNNTIHINPETRRILENYFMDPNDELAELLEMRFEGWSYSDEIAYPPGHEQEEMI